MLLSLALVFITMYHGNPCSQNGVKGGNYCNWAKTTKQTIKSKQYIIIIKNTDLRESKAKYLRRWITKNKHEIFIIIFIEHGPCFPRNNFQLILSCDKSVNLMSHLYFTLFRHEILWTYFTNDKNKTKKSGSEQETWRTMPKRKTDINIGQWCYRYITYTERHWKKEKRTLERYTYIQRGLVISWPKQVKKSKQEEWERGEGKKGEAGGDREMKERGTKRTITRKMQMEEEEEEDMKEKQCCYWRVILISTCRYVQNSHVYICVSHIQDYWHLLCHV